MHPTHPEGLRSPDRLARARHLHGNVGHPGPRDRLLVPTAHANGIERHSAPAQFTARGDITATIANLDGNSHVTHQVDAKQSTAEVQGRTTIHLFYSAAPLPINDRLRGDHHKSAGVPTHYSCVNTSKIPSLRPW